MPVLRLGVCAIAVASLWLPLEPTWGMQPSTPTTAKAPREHTTEVDVVGLAGDEGTAFDVSGGKSGDAIQGTTASRSGRSGTDRPPIYPAYFPALVAAPGGGYCIQPQRRLYSDPETAALYTDEQQFRWMMLAANGYELCSAAERPPGVPAVEASEFWRVMGEDLLPKPQPRIAPGYMLAGKMAYLEANSSPTARFEHGTPIGNLVINAQSTVWVDWGDGGGLTGPHDGPGLPWPNGKITHFWTNADAYDVRVVQRWTATWELAGRRGTLGGLSTEGVIDDFPVRQLEAVRNR